MNFSDPCSLADPGGEVWIKYSCDGPSGLPGHTPSLPHGPLGTTPRIQPGTL